MWAFCTALCLLVDQERWPKTKVKENNKWKIPSIRYVASVNSAYTTIADDRIREEIITEFFVKTCQFRGWMNENDVGDMICCSELAAASFDDIDFDCGIIPLLTGSVAEFYIEPMLSCVGDVDIMYHYSAMLAIPEGYTPPTQLPGEFDSRVVVCEIVNSEFPGYVYLVSSYLLTECVDDVQSRAV